MTKPVWTHAWALLQFIKTIIDLRSFSVDESTLAWEMSALKNHT